MQSILDVLKLKREYTDIAIVALNDFKSVKSEQLKNLAGNVVDRSLSDHKISRQGAKLCWEIIKSETKNSELKEEKIFRKEVLNILQGEYRLIGNKSKKHKLAYITFLCSIFDLYKFNEKPLLALLNPVYDCLTNLTNVKYANDDEIIQCLVTQLQFIGEQLDLCDNKKMDVLLNLLRELFLSDQSSQLTRLMLLEVIELRGGKWKLSPCAHKYYYGKS